MKFRITRFIDRGLRRRAGTAFAGGNGDLLGTRSHGGVCVSPRVRDRQERQRGTPPPLPPWSSVKTPVGVAARRLNPMRNRTGTALPGSSPSPHRNTSFRRIYEANRNAVRTSGK
jgi:hypothetical protein